MKKQLLVLGCAALAAIGAACSSDPALKSAVISPMEEPSEQIQQRFANEIRTLNELEMKQEVLTNCNGVLRYCQGVYNEDQPGKFAVLVFLHGFGERGEENLAQLRLGLPEIVKQIRDGKYKVIVLAPECPSDQVWAPLHRGGAMGDLMEEPYQALGMVPVLIQKKIEEFKADKKRVYVTGLSMGGYGCWDLLARYSTDIFAAGIPCCGGSDPNRAEAMRDLPVFIFHGSDDVTVPPQLARWMFLSMRKAGNQDVFLREFFGVGHNCWDKAYSDPKTWEWLFSQRRGRKSDVRPGNPPVGPVTAFEYEKGFGFNGGPRPKGSKPGDGLISPFPNAEEQAKQRAWQALESVEPAPAEGEQPAPAEDEQPAAE
jgi:poly(3-hydroxybutyrate) depolymerase